MWRIALVMVALLAGPARAGAEGVEFKAIAFGEGDLAGGSGIEIRYEIEWPVAGATTDALAAMRRVIIDEFASNLHVDKPAFDPASLRDFLEEAARRFDADHARFKKDFPDSALVGSWFDKRRVGVAFQQPPIVGMTFSYAFFTGGAHGLEDETHLIFDTSTGRRLGVADLVKTDPASSAALVDKIKTAIRAARGLAADASLEKEGYWEDKIAPMNPFLAAKSLGFRFNHYEIAPYAWGATTIEIPFEQLGDLLRSDSPAAAVWKRGSQASK